MTKANDFEPSATIEARRARAELKVTDFAQEEWERAQPVRIARYWSGAEAPGRRQAEARLLWTDEALYARFLCRQEEPLVVAAQPQIERKTVGLWERDVCEIFIAPDARAPERYFEFEIAPTGEWLDLAIRKLPEERVTDWEYRSDLEAAALALEREVVMALRLPWAAFGKRPESGEEWRANLFRCVGAGEGRGYLAWQPTRTERPDFHVPAAFGRLRFVE